MNKELTEWVREVIVNRDGTSNITQGDRLKRWRNEIARQRIVRAYHFLKLASKGPSVPSKPRTQAGAG